MIQHYYWPGMREKVREYVTQRLVCQRTKKTNRPKPPLWPLPVLARLLESITLDWMSGLPRDKRGKDSVVHIVDRFTKWVISISNTRHMTYVQLCDLLHEEVFGWIGLPAVITGDRDTPGTAENMRVLIKSMGVKLKSSVAYQPQTDGTTERFIVPCYICYVLLSMRVTRTGLNIFLRCCMRITILCTQQQDLLLI
jgi:hypothetical protein